MSSSTILRELYPDPVECALEVWLDKPEIRVGWVKSIAGNKCLSTILLSKDGIHRPFGRELRNWKLDGLEVIRLGEAGFKDELRKHVPGYANLVAPRLDRDEVEFVWDVLTVSMDDYEWLFDLEDFEPEDTEVDTTPWFTSLVEPWGGLKTTAVWMDEASDVSAVDWDALKKSKFEEAMSEVIARKERDALMGHWVPSAPYDHTADAVSYAGMTYTSTTVKATDSVLDVKKLEEATRELSKYRTATEVIGARRAGKSWLTETIRMKPEWGVLADYTKLT